MGKKIKAASVPSWDKPMKKPRADSKLKLRPAEEQETWWLLLHPTDADTPPYTEEQLLVHILDEHGVEVAASTLSEWVSWYALKLRMERAQERAQQTRLELAQDPTLSAKDLDRAGRVIFMAEALQRGDVKGYLGLAALEIAQAKVEQNERRLELAGQALQIDERRLALLEAKAAKLDAAQDVIKKQLSMEEENRRLREILK